MDRPIAKEIAMSDKTRQEFEAWHDKHALGTEGDAFRAWQHQQAIIDARDAEIAKLIEKVKSLEASNWFAAAPEVQPSQPSAPVVPEGEYLCPNCVTPWKCNGPHIPEPAQRDERSLCLAAWKNSEHYQHAYPDSIKRELFAEGWQAAIASRSKP